MTSLREKYKCNSVSFWVFYSYELFSKLRGEPISVCSTYISICYVKITTRGRPSRNAANTFPDFSAGLSQNSVIVKKILKLVEKHEKLNICDFRLGAFLSALVNMTYCYCCKVDRFSALHC